MSKPCIVMDTNVLISAGILSDSKSAQALTLALEHFTLAQNEATWNEFETRITRKKFDRYFPGDQRLEYIVAIARVSRFFAPGVEVSVSRDADDDKFIALAMDCGAEFIVSGDRDLKEIVIYQGIKIIPPAIFQELYKANP